MTREKLSTVYDEMVESKLYQNEAFKNQYISEIMADSLGYAGTEIIRRVVGDSKVKELSLISKTKKVAAERLLINCGIQLIKKRASLSTGQDLVDLFNNYKGGI
ncbi:MAG: S-methyl-5-thioribose kinase, partial [Enterococcus sp.]|nr:S-methyl-5-thioribose kinase [Enterococcus sp.]